MTDIQPKDILLGRGPVCYMNPGNKTFRKVIRTYSTMYTRSIPREVKREIVESLTKSLRMQGHRFLILSVESGTWHEASSSLVHAKVSHALRDARNFAANKDVACIDSEQARSLLCDSRRMTPSIEVENSVRLGVELEKSGKSAVAVSHQEAQKRKFLYSPQFQALCNPHQTSHEHLNVMSSLDVNREASMVRDIGSKQNFLMTAQNVSLPFPSLDLNYDRMSTLAQAALSNYCRVKSEILGSGTNEQEVKAELRHHGVSGRKEQICHLELSHRHHVQRHQRIASSDTTKVSYQELSPVLSRSSIEIADCNQAMIPTKIWCQGPE